MISADQWFSKKEQKSKTPEIKEAKTPAFTIKSPTSQVVLPKKHDKSDKNDRVDVIDTDRSNLVTEAAMITERDQITNRHSSLKTKEPSEIQFQKQSSSEQRD